MKASEIIACAEETLGTPWTHGGRLKGRGLDCIGLILWVCRQTGFSDYEPDAYPRTAMWYQFQEEFDKYLVKIPVDSAKPGDVLIFRQEMFPCHCGIMSTPRPKSGEPRFIHSYLPRHRVVEEVYTDKWRKLTRAAYRFPGLED